MVNISDDAILAFVDWFEKKYPARSFQLDQEDRDAVKIVCTDGFTVDFITFYAEMMGHNWYNHRHDPANTKTTIEEDQAQ